MILGIVPIGIMAIVAMIPHMLVNLGYKVPEFFTDPIFAMWAIMIGMFAALCIYFRQFAMFVFALVGSVLITLFVYVWYVLG